MRRILMTSLAACALALVGCGQSQNLITDAGTVPDAGSDAGSELTDAGSDAGSGSCQATTIACADQAAQDLDLKSTVNAAVISDSMVDGGFLSSIDATAGGITPTESYIYAKFSPYGLEKVDISDQQSQTSMDWDIAFRRYVIRLNGGDSGPSCVGAAAMLSSISYESVVEPPAGATYSVDDFENASCTFQADNSGLPTSPSTALSSYYQYANCVQMTGTVFVIQRADGTHVKLKVTDYYAPAPSAQQTCDSSGNPASNATGGHIRILWSFL